ncbi:MAG: CD1871A family CXXC motif-containing protein [Candidatus Desantisbacteria bacterium]
MTIIKQYLWIPLLILGIGFIIQGIMRVEYEKVYSNAAFICLSCIGIEEAY